MNTDVFQGSDAHKGKTPLEPAGRLAPAEDAEREDSGSGSSKPGSTTAEFSKREFAEAGLADVESARFRARSTSQEYVWNPEEFAREQLRGLVQQIFFSGASRRVRQLVISAAESQTDVSGICRQVGEMLALETSANVVVAAGDQMGLAAGEEQLPDLPKRDATATRVRTNLWLTPGLRTPEARAFPAKREMQSTTGWGARLCELRREFEYSILEGPSAGESNASAIALVADGLVLVLRAHGTRRAAVQWIRQTLQSRETHLLGTILAERRFPIPERIYRRL